MELKFVNKILPISIIIIETISIALVILAFANIIEFKLAILFLGMSQAFGGLTYVLQDKNNKYERVVGDLSILLGIIVMFIAILKSVM